MQFKVSFPGGLRDPSDPDVVSTALRETKEELGIGEEDIDVWGKMAPVSDKSGETLLVGANKAFCCWTWIDLD